MTDDLFRYIFVTQFFFLVILRLLFAHGIRKREGKFIFINKEVMKRDGIPRSVLKIMSWMFLLSAVFVSLFPSSINVRLDFDLPVQLRVMGIIFSCILLALLFWTHHSLGRQWSTILELRKDHELIISGPYRWIRHPMYSIGLSILISFWLITGNWLIMISFLCVCGMVLLRVELEEKMLLEHFGDEYHNYMLAAGRLIPKFK